MLSNQERIRILEKFQEIEQAISNGRPIGEIARVSVEDAEALIRSVDPVAPVLRTALVINWPESAMKKRYESFRLRFPEIDSLAALRTAMNEESPLDFCVNYLGINANPEKPEKNPKFVLLKSLTNGFLEYQASQKIPSEIEALRTWASNVDVNNLRYDPIGKLKGIGPGTVENIRLNLGYSTVKPDRHVIGVAQQILGISISPLRYTGLADFIGISPRRFDSALSEYGKLMGVST